MARKEDARRLLVQHASSLSVILPMYTLHSLPFVMNALSDPSLLDDELGTNIANLRLQRFRYLLSNIALGERTGCYRQMAHSQGAFLENERVAKLIPIKCNSELKSTW